MEKRCNKCSGFSLVEIIISIAIFSVLIGITTMNYRLNQDIRDTKLESLKVHDIIKKAQSLSMTGQSFDGIYFENFSVKADNCEGSICQSLKLFGNNGQENIIQTLELPKAGIVESDTAVNFISPRGKAQITVNDESTSTAFFYLINYKNNDIKMCVRVSAISGRIDVLKECQ